MTSPRILVVDDNPGTVELVERALGKAGFETNGANSGQIALDLIARNGLPNLAVVDIMMPGMDGFEFCRILHEYCDLPVVMLTALNEETTVTRAIQQVAEDYIVKPFSPRELVARVQRVLHRIGEFAFPLGRTIAVDDYLQVDFPGRQAIVQGDSRPLTPTETKLLYILMRNAGRVLTTDFILRRLWPFEVVHEDRLRVHIHRLRQKIERDPTEPEYIISERGAGYSFKATEQVSVET
ncbi:MAG: response regulator transcription factor [Chloroflexota bacterium]